MFGIKVDDEVSVELIHPSHADAVFEIVDRNRELFSKWLVWIENSKSVEDTRAFIRSAMQKYADLSEVTCVIFYKGVLVGNVALLNLKNKPNDTAKGELGYWLDSAYHKRGIMRRAISKMLEIGFGYYECNKIYIRCATTNERSCNIPQKLGFVHEGVFREDILVNGVKMDANIYSLLRWEWEASR